MNDSNTPKASVRVLVTGSRDWTHAATITTALDRLRAEHGSALVLVHGACPTGADAITEAWAHAHHVPVQAHPADWARYGRAAGPRRNAAMVATGPAACLAFIHNHSPGATGCAHLAEAAGIPTTRHTTGPTERSTHPMTTPPDTGPQPQEPDTAALRAAALAYAARGWHVFPLRPGDKRPAFPDHSEAACTGVDPRCRAAGRHVTWEQRATTDTDRITRAWATRAWGIGIATGPSGLVVIDLDVPKLGATPPGEWQRLGIVDGADVFADIAATGGFDAHPDTFTTATASGGTHLYYTHPTGSGWDGTALGNTAGSLGWLIDSRAHGGYVAAPPTTLHDGRTYTVANPTEAVPLPEPLAHALRPAPRPAPGPVTVTLPPTGSARRDAYLNAAIRNQLDHVTTAGEGTRNRALYTSALALGQLVAGGELDPDHITATLTEAAHTAGLKHPEIARTITSGLTAGGNRPRTLNHHHGATTPTTAQETAA